MPKNVSEARFSLEYAVSRSLIDGKLGPGQFQQKKVEDPLAVSLMKKIKPIYQEYVLTKEDIESGRFPVEMKVILNDGTELFAHKEKSNGASKNPFIRNDIEEKFTLSCADIFDEPRVFELIRIINEFEKLKDISKFTRLMDPVDTE
jgi:2-methylcitrate dehydratase PrpD